MDDQEIVRLCAEAMGYTVMTQVFPAPSQNSPHDATVYVEDESMFAAYNPLHDDAQCMALIKRFHVDIDWHGDEEGWQIYTSTKLWDRSDEVADDLNRAVCLAVARMQAAKSKANSVNI